MCAFFAPSNAIRVLYDQPRDNHSSYTLVKQMLGTQIQSFRTTDSGRTEENAAAGALSAARAIHIALSLLSEKLKEST